MATSELPPAALRRMAMAYRTSQIVHAVAKLSIPDLLADGPRTTEDLALATETHTPSLYRLLRAAASLGILEASDGRQFALTALGTLLRSDITGSMRAFAIGHNEPWFRRSWENLLYSIRTGKPAFDEVHGAG